MKKIKTKNEALVIFEYSARDYAKATLLGDYKIANKNCKKIDAAVHYLRSNGDIDSLKMMLKNDDIGVRTWAATYLLPVNTKESILVLEEIGKLNNLLGFDARMVLEQFQESD